MFNPGYEDDYYKLFDLQDGVAKQEEAPQTMQSDSEVVSPAEEIGMEDYSEDDLEKVDSKSAEQINPIKDADVEYKPEAKKKAKESREVDKHPLYLCNECCKTFRNNQHVCILCESKNVTPVTPIIEGVTELLGEVPEISSDDQWAVLKAIEQGHVSEQWPSEDVMIDELSKLEDIVDPEKEDDLKVAYLRYVIVPKSLSMTGVGESKTQEAWGDSQATRADDMFDKIKAKVGNMSDKELRKTIDKLTKQMDKMKFGYSKMRTQRAVDLMKDQLYKGGVVGEGKGEADKAADRFDKIKATIKNMSDKELRKSMDKMIKLQAKAKDQYAKEKNQQVIDLMDDEWGRRAKAARTGVAVDEQEELQQDHEQAKRKAEIQAKKAELQTKYHAEMERLDKELERYDV